MNANFTKFLILAKKKLDLTESSPLKMEVLNS